MKTFKHVPIEFKEIETITAKNGSRYYRLPSGESYPSVTTILSAHNKQGIMQWRERVGEEVANKISRQSATRGTKFHNLAEKYLKNEPITKKLGLLDLELFETAIPELEKIDNIRAQEVPLYSKYLRSAGRVDCIAEYDGKLGIIDFKTSRREKEIDHVQHYFMQASAYAVMFEELTNIPINNLVLIIAVEDGFMQVMKGKRNDYISQFLYYRDMYEKELKNK